VRRTVGYLPGEMGLYADLTGREVLDLLARLAGTRIDPAWRRTLQERFEIPESDLRRRLMQQGFYKLLDESRRGGATVFMS